MESHFWIHSKMETGSNYRNRIACSMAYSGNLLVPAITMGSGRARNRIWQFHSVAAQAYALGLSKSQRSCLRQQFYMEPDAPGSHSTASRKSNSKWSR